MVILHTDPLPLRMDERGTIRVGESRVSLDVLIADYKKGWSPEEIVRQLDTLKLADVHAVIAYYLRHQAEMEEYLLQRRAEADELRSRIESSQVAAKSARKLGTLKGTVRYIAPDFDAPLDDFKEYME